MTIRPTLREPWDDDRLGAAFAARAAANPTPTDQAGRVVTAIRADRCGAEGGWRGFHPALAMAAVVVVAAIVGMTLIASLRSVGPASSPELASPRPTDIGVLSEVAGLPVTTVVDAIAIRDAGVDDRELAVRGWFGPIPPVPCPNSLQTPVSPVQPRCPDQFIWLTEQPETLMSVEPNSLSQRPPIGPAIHPDLDLIESGWAPGLPDSGPAVPVEVVFVGHFDDRRSNLCPRADEAACRERFVVDRVDWVNGETLPTSVLDLLEGGGGRSFEFAQSAVEGVAPGATILSAVHVDGAVGLRGIEPSLGTGQGGLIDNASLWVVRVLASGIVATYVVVDGTGEVHEIGADGAPIPVPTAQPSPATVLGLPVISVPELIARRVAGPTPDEVAVRGWIATSNVAFDCAIHLDPPHPLVPFCKSPIFIMEQPEQPDGLSTRGPSVASIIGSDAHIDAAISRQVPVEVVAIGHLADHRWTTCPTTEREACQRQFVVDRILAVGTPVDETPEPWRLVGSAPSEPTATPDDVIRTLQAQVGDLTVMSIGYADGDVLYQIEPTVADHDGLGLVIQQQSRWVVRTLVAAGPDPMVARTFLIRDSPTDDPSGSVWELTVDGPVLVLHASPQDPSP